MQPASPPVVDRAPMSPPTKREAVFTPTSPPVVSAPITTPESKRPSYGPPKTTPPAQPLPNPYEEGLVKGKGKDEADPEKWCALCERDGHDATCCPFEDAF